MIRRLKALTAAAAAWRGSSLCRRAHANKSWGNNSGRGSRPTTTGPPFAATAARTRAGNDRPGSSAPSLTSAPMAPTPSLLPPAVPTGRLRPRHRRLLRRTAGSFLFTHALGKHQIEHDPDNGRQGHALQLEGTQVDGGAADAHHENHRSDDEVALLRQIHPAFHQ